MLPSKNRRSILITPTVLAVLAVTVMAIYADILNSPFVFDDSVFLNNPRLLFTEMTPDRIAGLTKITAENVSPRLVPNFTFALNYFLHRRQVTGYHFFNLMIHLVTTFLLYLVCRHTLVRCGSDSRLVPFLTALLWTVNPVHTHSVTFIWQRMNSLMALFFMLTLYGYIRFRETNRSEPGDSVFPAWAFFAIGTVSALLAAVCKQTATTLPIVLFLYEWYFFQNLDMAWLKRKLPWICLAALVCGGLALWYLDFSPVKTILATYANKAFTPGQRLLTEPRVILYYITLLLFPHPSRLNLDIDFPLSTGLLTPADTLTAIIALPALIVAAAALAKRHRLLSFAIIWFIVNLAVESSVVGLEPIYAYRTYLPSVFPFMALVAGCYQTIKPRPAAVLLLILAVVISCHWTVVHNRVWQNRVSLWRDIADKSPRSARAFHNLGLAYKDTGDCRRAVEAYRQALRLRLAAADPDNDKTGQTLNNLGVAYDCLHQAEKAADSYEQALAIFKRRLGPNHAETTAVYNNLCVLYGRSGDFDRAIYWCGKALAVRRAVLGRDHPAVADLHNNLGLALAEAGELAAARRHLETALAIYQRHLGTTHPKTRQCRENLSRLPASQQQPFRDNGSPDTKP